MIVDVLLETGWSWTEWLATPAWFQAVTVHMIQARRERAQRDHEEHEAQMRATRR